jgi:hypothetical protein
MMRSAAQIGLAYRHIKSVTTAEAVAAAIIMPVDIGRWFFPSELAGKGRNARAHRE